MSEILDDEKATLSDQFMKWLDYQYATTPDDIKSVISINTCEYLPNYKVDLNVKYEQRDFIFNQIKPYGGEKIPESIAPLLGKWDYNLDSDNYMVESEKHYSILKHTLVF